MFIRGDHLSPRLQSRVKARYVHRFTREHKPAWAKQEWRDGKPYPLQFDSDADWLAHTEFPVTIKGELADRPTHCYSTPTWPDNPELRR